MALTIAIEGKGVIANCDGISDSAGGTWSEVGGGSIEYATDAYLTGSGCIGGAYSNKTGRQQYDLGSGSELDFDTAGTEEGQSLYIWIQTSTIYLHESIANGGLTVNFATTTSDYRTFMIAAGDDTNDWTGDWKCFVIDPTKAGTVSDTGTSFDIGSIRYIWVDLDITALAKGNNINIDMMAVGTGLRVTGTSTDVWGDISTYCNDRTNRAWGMVQEREGIYYVYGKIYFGDATNQAAAQSFVDTSAPIVKFATSEYYYSAAWAISVPTTFGGIVIEDKSTYSTTFTDGIAVGTDSTGRAGATYIGHADINVSLDLYGGNEAASVTILYGTSIYNCTGAINMGNDTGHKLLGVSFSGCAQVDPVGAPVIRNCVFAATADADAALLWNENINIQDCNFLANTTGAAIEMPSAAGTPYTYTKLYFADNTYDVLNSATALTIQKGGTPASDPSSYEGSTVTFSGSVDITITVKDTDSQLVSNVWVGVYKTSDRTAIVHEETVAGVAADVYTGSTPVEVEVRCRKASSGDDPRYKNYSSLQTISGTGLTMTVTLQEDPNNNATT